MEGRTTKHCDSLVARMKSVKNKTEVDGMRRCQLRDGAAVVRYLAWLDEQVNAAEVDPTLNEYTGALKSEEFRSVGEHYRGLSFGTISSIGPNGAVIHYEPSEATALPLNNQQVYLLDSGAQYMDGTTDTTRTVHFSQPTAH